MASQSFSSADDWRAVLARVMTGRESGNILVFVAGHDDRTAPLAEAVEVIASMPNDWKLVLAFDQETLFGNEWVPELGPNVRVLSWKDDGAHYYSRHFITTSPDCLHLHCHDKRKGKLLRATQKELALQSAPERS